MKLPWFKVAAIGASLALGLGATLIPQMANATPSPCGTATQVDVIDGSPQCQITLGPASYGNSTNTSFAIPRYVTSVSVDIFGGAGVDVNPVISGGQAAEIKATLPVAYGDNLRFEAAGGGGGGAAAGYCNNSTPYVNYWDGNGGGYSKIYNTNHTNQLLVAGAGGGGGCGDISGTYHGNGANGGHASLPAYTDSSNVYHAAVDATAGGNWTDTGAIGGGPGTQTAGGAGGSGDICAGQNGTSFTGGNIGCNSGRPGGGGGGGYYGGGAGGSRGAGGGGGSSFVGDGWTVTGANLTSATIMTGKVVISFAVVTPGPLAPSTVGVQVGDGTAYVWAVPDGSGAGTDPTSTTITANPGGNSCTLTNPLNVYACNIDGLTNGVAYTFSAVSTNSYGTSASVDASGTYTPSAPMTLVPQATIEGLDASNVARVTQTLHAVVVGDWDPGVSLAYQWYVNGSPINGATGTDYTPTAADFNQSLSYGVVATKYGFTDTSIGSPWVPVYSDKPTVYGNYRVGNYIYSDAGLWPVDANLHYQWRANGVPIAGANDSVYSPVATDLGKRISVAITADNYPLLPVKYSPATSKIAKGIFQDTSMPQLSGRALSGLTLYADPGYWDPRATLSYSWYSGNQVIPGATSDSYQITQQDAGKGIAVRVTASAPGYQVTWRTSAYSKVPFLLKQSGPGKPWLWGDAKVGSQLYVDTGSWDPESTQQWVWCRNGKAISGTEGRNDNTVTIDDVGSRITVKLLSTQPGYMDLTQISNRSTLVLTPQFNAVGIPRIHGVGHIGETITVHPGKWDSAANFTYRWYYNGKRIDGETSSTFTIPQEMLGGRILAKVYGSAPGYLPTFRNSQNTIKVIP